jgi:hypothetical protein
MRWALLLAVLFGLGQPAEARMHAPYEAHRIRPSSSVPVLDTFTAPSGAYGFRRLKSTYAGNALRIRRASDNAELDIGFLGGTGFTGAPWDEAAANAHCAATTCFVRTWYDQSGNARDLIQVTPASQPQVIFGCQNFLACLQTTGAQSVASASLTPATGLVSLSAVTMRTVGTGQCYPLTQNGFLNRINYRTAAGTSLSGGTGGQILNSAAEGAWHALAGVINAAASVLNTDGSELTGTVTGNTTAGTISFTGIAATTCWGAEAILWDNYALTAGERSALVANQRAFWGF